ncbi:MAG: cell division protein FtsZ [Eubacteriales bacterium]
MSLENHLEMKDQKEKIVKIQVIGVGGGGCNVVKRMVDAGTKDVEFIAVNTDLQALNKSNATLKIQIGKKLTEGKGAGADPEKGKKSAEENRQEIAEILSGTDMVFITAGMGGGTGTGAAPVIAQIAKEMGILTVAVVTKPFVYEREKRMKIAERGIAELYQHVDSLVVIANDNVKKTLPKDKKISFLEGFAIVDSLLQYAVTSLTELIQITGYINLDFADVNAVMRNAGLSHMGFGVATGENKAEEAARKAVESPLLDVGVISGAKGIILNITCPSDMDFNDPDIISDYVKTIADPDVNFIFGVAIDEELVDEIRVTVIAAGIDEANPAMFQPESILSQRKETLPEPLTREEQPAPLAPEPVQRPVQSSLHTFDPMVRTVENTPAPEPLQTKETSSFATQPIMQPLSTVSVKESSSTRVPTIPTDVPVVYGIPQTESPRADYGRADTGRTDVGRTDPGREKSRRVEDFVVLERMFDDKE